MRSLLIKDTTREEREEIVLSSLGAGIGCEDSSDGYDFYLPYIEGLVELEDLNMHYRAPLAKAAPNIPPHFCPGNQNHRLNRWFEQAL